MPIQDGCPYFLLQIIKIIRFEQVSYRLLSPADNLGKTTMSRPNSRFAVASSFENMSVSIGIMRKKFLFF